MFISHCKTDEINDIIFSLANDINLNIENKNEYIKNLLINLSLPNIINNYILQKQEQQPTGPDPQEIIIWYKMFKNIIK